MTRTGSRKTLAYAVCEAYKGRGEVQMVPLAEVPQQDPIDMYQPPEGVETKDS